MFNRIRTVAVLGYDFDPSKRRRTKEEIEAQPNVKKKSELKVVDNCPTCDVERIITYKQSKKNKPCSKCFHNSDKMIEAKKNQNKIKSEETKQKMKENHWSKNGYKSAFKGKKHTDETKSMLAKKSKKQAEKLRLEIGEEEYLIKMALMKRKISREEFEGFVTEENTAIRQSKEGKEWRRSVLRKHNWTCDNCQEPGSHIAHHLNAFNAYPEQRFDVDNGVCLCEQCHNNFHKKYGKGWNTKEQYSLFKTSNKPHKI